jgi:hypothetical protein
MSHNIGGVGLRSLKRLGIYFGMSEYSWSILLVYHV